jgi:hypothetical protein
MRRVICCIAAFTFAVHAFAAEKESALSQLDKKVIQSLATDKWDDASRTFVLSLWEDYKEAHLNPGENIASRSSLFGKMPTGRDYGQYTGTFVDSGGAASRRRLHVMKDEKGRFSVTLEGHTIPAVTWNGCIVFTTGDVIHPCLPGLSEKPYCTLEMFMVISTDDGFYFGSPGMPPDKWLNVSKL